MRVVHIVGPTAEDVTCCAGLCKELMGKVRMHCAALLVQYPFAQAHAQPDR